MSSPIMMLWLDLRVRTSTPAVSPAEGIAAPNKAAWASGRNGQPFGVWTHVDFGSQVGSVRRRLARRSLKPQLNQIRTWVRQGRTDAWIAHQLDVSVGDIRAFKREHELAPAEARRGRGLRPGHRGGGAGPARRGRRPRGRGARGRAPGRGGGGRRRGVRGRADDGDADDADGDDKPRRRRRGRRGGRGRSRTASRRRSRARSTTARRATGSGSTRPCRTTPPTRSTGRATAP